MNPACDNFDAILRQIDDLLNDSDEVDADILLRRIWENMCGDVVVNTRQSQNEVTSDLDTR